MVFSTRCNQAALFLESTTVPKYFHTLLVHAKIFRS